MAEALGVAAGVAGFVSLLGQFVGAANTLREIRTYADKAPADLDAVVKDLEFLVGIMSSVAGRSHQQQDAFLQHCKTSCDRVADHLRQLEEKISPLRGAQQRGKRENFESYSKCATGEKILATCSTALRRRKRNVCCIMCKCLA